ncbi:MAG: YeeE/YedE family protein [Methylophilaceae bacterium]
MINWAEFTPPNSLLGGMLIGLAASMLILLNGRIAGISGILGGLLTAKGNDTNWRLAFLSGLIVAPLLYGAVHVLPAVTINAGNTTIIIAGLLVGIGTRYGSGCTSGHGVCGIARLSPRSIAATCIFILAGVVTVFLARQLGW